MKRNLMKYIALFCALVLLFSGCGGSAASTPEPTPVSGPEVPDLKGVTVENARLVLEVLGFARACLSTGDPLSNLPLFYETEDDQRFGWEEVLVTGQSIAPGERWSEDRVLTLECAPQYDVFLEIRSEHTGSNHAHVTVNVSGTDGCSYGDYSWYVYSEDEREPFPENSKEDFRDSLYLPAGEYVITVGSPNTPSEIDPISVIVAGHTTVSAVLKTGDSISLKKLTISESTPDRLRTVPDVSGMIFEDGREELLYSFTRVVEKPLVEKTSTNHDYESWVCVSTKPEAGERVDKDTTITLKTVPPEEYEWFRRGLVGQPLTAAEPLLKEKRLRVIYVDKETGNRIDWMIRSCPENRKNGWFINSVYGNPDYTLTLAMTYYGDMAGGYPDYSVFAPQQLTAGGVTYEIDAAYGYEPLYRNSGGVSIGQSTCYLFDYDTGTVFEVNYGVSSDIPFLSATKGTFEADGPLPDANISVFCDWMTTRFVPVPTETGTALAEYNAQSGETSEELYRPVSIADFVKLYEYAELTGRVE